MKNRYFVVFCLILLFIFSTGIVKAQHIEILQQGKSTSIRGLSVVNDNVAWLSGSKGYVALTTDAGKTWQWQQVKGYEQADFRSVVAFSDKEAMIMSSGIPALILKTTDGGISWTEKYRNTDTAYFFDAMDFADTKHGLVLGDPIKNKFVLLETINSGETWKSFDTPPDALPGEAAFAASGTCLRYSSSIEIVTGGSYSRYIECNNDVFPHSWTYYQTSIKHGKSSQGAFSVSQPFEVIVGGDYQKDKLTDSIAEYFYDGSYGGYLMRLSKIPPVGYQSCVESIGNLTFLSTGTPGTNISVDGGRIWNKIDGNSFNVCRKAKHGTLILLAGNNGKIGILKP